ncbi:hypothetical protein NL676_010079 [Syzygium grande]|nr:hypothetical protein NL676_010079 [Syzygium grande]
MAKEEDRVCPREIETTPPLAAHQSPPSSILPLMAKPHQARSKGEQKGGGETAHDTVPEQRNGKSREMGDEPERSEGSSPTHFIGTPPTTRDPFNIIIYLISHLLSCNYCSFSPEAWREPGGCGVKTPAAKSPFNRGTATEGEDILLGGGAAKRGRAGGRHVAGGEWGSGPLGNRRLGGGSVQNGWEAFVNKTPSCVSSDQTLAVSMRSVLPCKKTPGHFDWTRELPRRASWSGGGYYVLGRGAAGAPPNLPPRAPPRPRRAAVESEFESAVTDARCSH